MLSGSSSRHLAARLSNLQTTSERGLGDGMPMPKRRRGVGDARTRGGDMVVIRSHDDCYILGGGGIAESTSTPVEPMRAIGARVGPCCLKPSYWTATGRDVWCGVVCASRHLTLASRTNRRPGRRCTCRTRPGTWLSRKVSGSATARSAATDPRTTASSDHGSTGSPNPPMTRPPSPCSRPEAGATNRASDGTRGGREGAPEWMGEMSQSGDALREPFAESGYPKLRGAFAGIQTTGARGRPAGKGMFCPSAGAPGRPSHGQGGAASSQASMAAGRHPGRHRPAATGLSAAARPAAPQRPTPPTTFA